jgi:hypothetical protein
MLNFGANVQYAATHWPYAEHWGGKVPYAATSTHSAQVHKKNFRKGGAKRFRIERFETVKGSVMRLMPLLSAAVILGLACPFAGVGVASAQEDVTIEDANVLPSRSAGHRSGVADGTGIAGGMLPPATTAPKPVVPVKPKTQGPPSLFDVEVSANEDAVEPPATVHVRINVPHNHKAVDVFAAYPYPVKLPQNLPPTMLPEKPKELKNMLLSSGYAARTSGERPYPMGGWRWQDAYRIALAKSHLAVPHTIVGMYPWIKEITPWVVVECKRINAREKQRWERYLKFKEEYDRNHVDIENDAVRAGLAATVMRPRRGKPGYVEKELPAGNWWITCTRRLPGLTYYWQIPVTAAAGEHVNLMLTENNMLVATGGW